MKDYYQILGVERSASDDEIKRAYRRMASKHHPDKGGDKTQFQEVEEAYRILGNPQSRSEYDNPQSQMQFGGFGQQGFNFNDIFEMFGVNPSRQAARQGLARISVWITLEDAAQGGPKIIAVQSGSQVSNIEIDIPAGLNDGDTIRYAKLAPGGHDLVITYRIREHSIWNREGKNITTERVIEIWDLILGCEIPIQDLTGSTLVLTVPPKTQPGSMLRIKGRGLPGRQLPGDPRNPGNGDLLVKVQARLPGNIPDEIISIIKKHTGR